MLQFCCSFVAVLTKLQQNWKKKKLKNSQNIKKKPYIFFAVVLQLCCSCDAVVLQLCCGFDKTCKTYHIYVIYCLGVFRFSVVAVQSSY